MFAVFIQCLSLLLNRYGDLQTVQYRDGGGGLFTIGFQTSINKGGLDSIRSADNLCCSVIEM